jgi:hypothetical protein
VVNSPVGSRLVGWEMYNGLVRPTCSVILITNGELSCVMGLVRRRIDAIRMQEPVRNPKTECLNRPNRKQDHHIQ